MQIVTFVQLSDLHFPDAENMTIDADLRDVRLATTFTHKIAAAPLTSVMNHLQRHSQDVAGYLICGDLTSYGNHDAYVESVRYLIAALQLDNLALERIHVVPGNHDVDRAECMLGQESKFDRIHQAWAGAGRDVLAKALRTSFVTCKKKVTQVISINSCLGCGEFRRHLGIDDTDGGNKSPDLPRISDYDEQLDAPAFDQQAVDLLLQTLDDTKDTMATLVVSHHPLLPQPRPRVAPYAELINGGFVRNHLGGLRHPTIYCHGHAHRDSIEILRQPDSAPQVIVGSPQFRDGYNLLQIGFGTDKKPLGLTVHKVRRVDGTVKMGQEVRIPLRGPQNPLERQLRQVIRRVSDKPKRFNDLLDQLRDNTNPRFQGRTVSSALKEAEWLGLVNIANRDAEPRHWVIERVGP